MKERKCDLEGGPSGRRADLKVSPSRAVSEGASRGNAREGAIMMGRIARGTIIQFIGLNFPHETDDKSFVEVCPTEESPPPPLHGPIGRIEREDEGIFVRCCRSNRDSIMEWHRHSCL